MNVNIVKKKLICVTLRLTYELKAPGCLKVDASCGMIIPGRFENKMHDGVSTA